MYNLNWIEAKSTVNELMEKGWKSYVTQHNSGSGRYIFIGGESTTWEINALPRDFPLCLPFKLKGHLIQIKQL